MIVSGRLCLHQDRSELQRDRATAEDARGRGGPAGLLGIEYFDAVLVHDPPEMGPVLAPAAPWRDCCA